jgi:hypothetical protein
MKPIDDLRRRRMFALSAALCTFSVLLIPIAGRSSLELPVERATGDTRLTIPSIEDATPEPAIVIARDPFAGNHLRVQQAAGQMQAIGSNGVVGLRVVQGQPTGITLPDARDVVRAVVSGATGAHALVEEGDHTKVVSVGDNLAGSTIVGIDAHGIRLRNGTRLPLDGGTP